MKARKWMIEYGVAMLFAAVCALVFGHLSLFRQATVGKLHASDLVQFFGYGGAMVLAWLGARGLANDPPEDWKWILPYRPIVLPVVALFTVGLSYEVVLFVCEPYLGKLGRALYNWAFVIGIIAACAWLILTWVQKCGPQLAGTEPRRLRKAA